MKKFLSKQKQKEVAQARITTLFQQAAEVFSTRSALSHRYVTLARKIAMKVKTRIPQEFKRRFCKHCYKYLMPSSNCRIRTRDGKLIIYCLECKKYTRIMLKVRRKENHEK